MDFAIRVSSDLEDPLWDRFLVSSFSGQFQQSSAWSRVKALEGWKTTRYLITRKSDSAIVAGFQVNWKSRGLLKIGYISKGPVSAPDSALPLTALLRVVKAGCRAIGLSAVIVQPPDTCGEWEETAKVAGMLPQRLTKVISATVSVDLTQSQEAIERNFSKNVWRQIRKTRAANLRFRFAEVSEAPLFFELMVQTCQRQGVAPNPSSANSIATMLDAFGPKPATLGRMDARILFAELDGTVAAATLLIRFGDRLTEFKKGWVGRPGGLVPNKALVHEGILWGSQIGCTRYDFAGISRDTAEYLLQGGKISDRPVEGTDEFKLHFGGSPALLPRARLWIPAFPMRMMYRLVARSGDHHSLL